MTNLPTGSGSDGSGGSAGPAAPRDPVHEIDHWRAQLVRRILQVALVIGFVSTAYSSYTAVLRGDWLQVVLYLVAYGVVVALYVVPGVSYRLQAMALVAVVYGLGVFTLIQFAAAGPYALFLLTACTTAQLLVGRRAGLFMGIVATLTILAGGLGHSQGWLVASPRSLSDSALDFSSWVSWTAVFAMLTASVAVSQEHLATRSREALAEQQRAIGALEDHSRQLQAIVSDYVGHMTQVAQGNLALRVALPHSGAGDGAGDGDGSPAAGQDPLVVLGRQLNDTTASLQAMISQTREAAAGLAAASAEIQAATTQQAAGAAEQSAAIAETTTTVDEVKTIAEQAAGRAQKVADGSQRTLEVSRAGQRAMQDMLDSMGQIRERVEDIAEDILALSEQTQQIGEIISTVNDLAAQSNLLALNAAVEAARAGEQGKGFAVVAAEVRALAEQSRQATAQIKAILAEIQKATNAAVMATEEGTKGVDRGALLANEARQAIEQLAAAIHDSTQTAVQMVAGGRQQLAGVEQIAGAMRHINDATTQSLASTRQAERAAENLNALAHDLSETVARYTL